MCNNMCNATCFGIFLRRKMMFVHKSNPNYLAKCNPCEMYVFTKMS